jgi:hypothetical protein
MAAYARLVPTMSGPPDIGARSTDGKVTTDRRMFMAKVLSQVPLD